MHSAERARRIFDLNSAPRSLLFARIEQIGNESPSENMVVRQQLPWALWTVLLLGEFLTSQGLVLPLGLSVHQARQCRGSVAFRSLRCKGDGMPENCCGDDAQRSLRLPTQGIDLPGWVDSALAGLFAVGGLLPASIKVDEALQNGSARINSLTNAETREGVRLYVARPSGDPLGTLLVIHQVRPELTVTCALHHSRWRVARLRVPTSRLLHAILHSRL